MSPEENSSDGTEYNEQKLETCPACGKKGWHDIHIIIKKKCKYCGAYVEE